MMCTKKIESSIIKPHFHDRSERDEILKKLEENHSTAIIEIDSFFKFKKNGRVKSQK